MHGTNITEVANWRSADAAPAGATPTELRRCCPCSPACTKAGSIGMDGSMGTLNSAHIRWTEPFEGRISINLDKTIGTKTDNCSRPTYYKRFMQSHSEQQGQVKPAILVTTPRTGILTFSQNVSSFITSLTATSCGVVTTTAPSMILDK